MRRGIGDKEQRFFWVLASFSLSHRPLTGMLLPSSLAKTPKFFAAEMAKLFFQTLVFQLIFFEAGGWFSEEKWEKKVMF